MDILKIAIATLLTISLMKAAPPDEYGLTDEEFEFISAVVEAESDRSDDIEGRIFIAAVILNRVESDYFPDTINEVLTQRNQFSTVRNGRSVCEATDLSDEAVLEAIDRLEVDAIPHNLLFFNCRGYNYGTAYDCIGGNYFMTYGEVTDGSDR